MIREFEFDNNSYIADISEDLAGKFRVAVQKVNSEDTRAITFKFDESPINGQIAINYEIFIKQEEAAIKQAEVDTYIELMKNKITDLLGQPE